MRLKLSLIVLLSFLLSSSGCKTGPQVTVCVSDPARGVFDCWSESTQTASTLTYAESDKYVAFSPDDAKKLLDYCYSQQESTNGSK